MSSQSSLITLSKYLRDLYRRCKETSTKNKWKYGLVGGMVFSLTGRYIYCKLYNWYYSIPDGPIGLPFIGNSLSTLIDNKWNMKLAIHYGVVFSLYEYNKLTIFINDSYIAKKVLSEPNTTDRGWGSQSRQQRFILVAAQDNTPSFFGSNGEKWLKIRKLIHDKIVRVMNTEYLNKIMPEFIKNDLEPTLNAIISNDNGEHSKQENVWYCRKILSQLTFNIIFEAIVGKTNNFKNNDLRKELAKDLVDLLSWKVIKRYLPFALLPNWATYIFAESYYEPLYNIRKRICDNIKIMIKYKNDDDDAFMHGTRRLAEEDCDYPESQEIADIFIMFLAGTDTTSLTAEWGLLLLSKQGDIQDRVRNELLNVLNKNNIDYKTNSSNIKYDINLLIQLPLFRACIHEILRISCVSKTGIEHQNNCNDIWIETKNGYKYRLPKGCSIQYNVQAIHENVFENEKWKNKKYNLNIKQICLENWLKEDNATFYQNESFITFGHGKRDCVGKQLAMKQLRVIFGYLLINYKFSLQSKYINMKCIPYKGDVRVGIAKPVPEIPLLIQRIQHF